MADALNSQPRKRPGGALDDLVRKTIHLSAASDQNWLPGEAQARLTRGPVMALQPEAMEKFRQAVNDDSLGLTYHPDVAGELQLKNLIGLSPYLAPLVQKLAGGRSVAVYPAEDHNTARHEIAHQAIHDSPNLGEYQMNIPDRAVDIMKARGYKPEEYAAEYPAFLAGDPTEVGLTPQFGRQELQNFIDKIVMPKDPELALRWKRQAGLTAPSTAEADRSYSNPNVTF